MLIRLISLAILLLLIDANHISFADDKFLLPKNKPSVFKKIEKNKNQIKDLVPQSKPIIQTQKNVVIKQKSNEKQVSEKEKLIEEKKEAKIKNFIIPQKKPKTVKNV